MTVRVVERSELRRSHAVTAVCGGSFTNLVEERWLRCPQLVVAKGPWIELWTPGGNGCPNIPDYELLWASERRSDTVEALAVIAGIVDERNDAALAIDASSRWQLLAYPNGKETMIPLRQGSLMETDGSKRASVGVRVAVELPCGATLISFWQGRATVIAFGADAMARETELSSLVAMKNAEVIDATFLRGPRGHDRQGNSLAVMLLAGAPDPWVSSADADAELLCVSVVTCGNIRQGGWSIEHVPRQAHVVACTPNHTTALLLVAPFEARLYTHAGRVLASLEFPGTGRLAPIVADTANCCLQSDVASMKVAVADASSEAIDLITFAIISSYGDDERMSLQLKREEGAKRAGEPAAMILWLAADIYLIVHASGEALVRARGGVARRMLGARARPVDVALDDAECSCCCRALPMLATVSRHNLSLARPLALSFMSRDEIAHGVRPHATPRAARTVPNAWLVVVSSAIGEQPCFRVTYESPCGVTVQRVAHVATEVRALRSIAFGEIADGVLVHVARDAIRILDGSGQRVMRTTRAVGIIGAQDALYHAALDGKYALVAGTWTVALVVIDPDPRVSCRIRLEYEVAALALAAQSGPLVAVACWDCEVIQVYCVAMATFEMVYEVRTPSRLGAVLIRSLLFAERESLLVGLADGHVMALSRNDCHVFRVGGTPIALHPTGDNEVLALGTVEAAIFVAADGEWRRFEVAAPGRLVPLRGGPSSLFAWVSANGDFAAGVLDGRLEARNRIDVRLDAVATIVTFCGKYVVVAGCDAESSLLLLHDARNLAELARRSLDSRIFAMCRAPMPPLDISGIDPGADAVAIAVDGAVTLCWISSDRGIMPLAALRLGGCCKSLVSILDGERIALAADARVSVVGWNETQSAGVGDQGFWRQAEVEPVEIAGAATPAGVAVNALAVSDHFIAVAELCHSVSVFRYDGDRCIVCVAADVSRARPVHSLALLMQSDGRHGGSDDNMSSPLLIVAEEGSDVFVLQLSSLRCQVLCAAPHEDGETTLCDRVTPPLSTLEEVATWRQPAPVVALVSRLDRVLCASTDGTLDQLQATTSRTGTTPRIVHSDLRDDYYAYTAR